VSDTFWTVAVGDGGAAEEAGAELAGCWLELATGRAAEAWWNEGRVSPVPTERRVTGRTFRGEARRTVCVFAG
jgi:hypothetical protein